MKLLKNVWTGVVNFGWLTILGIVLFNSQGSANLTKVQSSTKVAPKDATKDVARPEDPPDFAEDVKAEADRNEAKMAEMRRIKEQAVADVEAMPDAPIRWPVQIVPRTTPNLHETYEPGEPYSYSLARNLNNELRWTINEFRWRLNERMEQGKNFWDLSEIDGPNLDAPLPKKLSSLTQQNWNLSWRANRLADMMNGLQFNGTEKAPSMPKGSVKILIPAPSCNGDFCRVPLR